MYRLFHTLFITLISLNSFAQNCMGPINPRAFGLQLQQLRALPNDAARLRTAEQTLLPYCLSSTQIFQVCKSFMDDQYRVDLAYAAYAKVLDPQHFYDVYDALDLKSSAFRLHDLLSGVIQMEAIPFPEPVVEPIPVPVCEVTAAEMSEIKSLVSNASFKDSMEKQALLMLKSKKCFRVDQIGDLLTVFSYDDSKLLVAKYAYDFCVDRQNYYKLVQSMTFKGSQDDLTQFIGSKN